MVRLKFTKEALKKLKSKTLGQRNVAMQRIRQFEKDNPKANFRIKKIVVRKE